MLTRTERASAGMRRCITVSDPHALQTTRSPARARLPILMAKHLSIFESACGGNARLSVFYSSRDCIFDRP